MSSKLLKVIGNFLIVIIILAFLPMVVPRLLGMQGYEVISGSMEPSISVGSIVYVKSVDFSELEEGDVIAFESGASVVTHRITSINTTEQLITTKGDANEIEDFTPVAYVNVLGKIIWHMPIIGYVAAWLTNIIGKIVAAIVLIIGVILSSAGDKRAAKETKDSSPRARGINPKAILAIGIVIVFGSLGGFLYIFMGYQKSNNLYANLNSSYTFTEESTNWEDMIEVDFDSLQKINPDVIGWIYIEGTDISYPIMYSGDDEGYLHTTINGEYATAGSIFLEGYNLPDFSDSHNVIYGHNMRNLSMFGSLKYFKTEDGYLDDHQYFQVITPTSKMRFEIFSYFDTDPASWVYAVPYSDSEDFAEYIDSLITHSYEDIETEEITSSDQIVTLSTCSSAGRRFTIHGVLKNNISL